MLATSSIMYLSLTRLLQRFCDSLADLWAGWCCMSCYKSKIKEELHASSFLQGITASLWNMWGHFNHQFLMAAQRRRWRYRRHRPGGRYIWMEGVWKQKSASVSLSYLNSLRGIRHERDNITASFSLSSFMECSTRLRDKLRSVQTKSSIISAGGRERSTGKTLHKGMMI